MTSKLTENLLGLLVGLCMAAGIIIFIVELGEPEEAPPPAFSDPATRKIVESKVSNRGLPENWPRGELAIWGEGWGPYPYDNGGLIIWDSSGNERRKIFRVRQAVRKPRGSANQEPPIVTVFMEPGDRVQLDLQPGTYEVYAMSGVNYQAGFDESADVVSYGYTFVYETKPSVIAIGAIDQEVTIVDRNWF